MEINFYLYLTHLFRRLKLNIDIMVAMKCAGEFFFHCILHQDLHLCYITQMWELIFWTSLVRMQTSLECSKKRMFILSFLLSNRFSYSIRAWVSITHKTHGTGLFIWARLNITCTISQRHFEYLRAQNGRMKEEYHLLHSSLWSHVTAQQGLKKIFSYP